MEFTLSQTAIEDIAAALVAARKTGIAADHTPWADTPLTPADRNRVQEIVAEALGWNYDARQPSHWKGGGPGPGSQAHFARLPEPWVQRSPGSFPAAGFHRPGIEIEVAFRLARDIEAGDLALRSAQDPAAFLDAMAVTIELVDFRWAGQTATPGPLRDCDLQSNAALVVGDWTPMRAVDWAAQVATVEIDGQPVGRYQGAHAAGDPLWFSSQWLQHAVARHGRLAEGSVLTTGSWCGMVWLDGPCEVIARFEGIGEARLALAR